MAVNTFETCPTCRCTDHAQVVVCPDPWHADAHLRRAARIKAAGIDDAQLNAERRANITRERFELRLRHFVKEWAPDNDRDRYEMSVQLNLLMREAMSHERAVTEQVFNMATAYTDRIAAVSQLPLNAIFTPPFTKKGE